MNNTLNIQQPCNDYLLMQDAIKTVRDCVEGEPAIKRGKTTYLKHPNMIDSTSPQQVARYAAYLDGAEFDEYPATTLASMLGQMSEGEIQVELPDRLAKLEQDIDGDGMPLSGAVEIIYSNVLQVKFHILLAEFKGLANVDIESVSIADVNEQNPRAVVKMYNRESLIDWEYRRVNGRQQLTLMVLVEESIERTDNFTRIPVKSYLICALDDEGNYYQQKYVESGKTINKDGERVYIRDPSGNFLKWIPAEIIIDEEWPAGTLPRRPGFLYPTCQMALYRYRMSADYKEALRFMQPTTFTKGWTEGDKELFEDLNKRDYIAFGAGVSNNLPNQVEVEIKGLGVESEPYERYFDNNEKRSRAVGAIINDPSQGADVTATKSVIDNKNSTAVMNMIVKNTESSLKRVILYCGMFEGLWPQENIEASLDQITLTLPREFVSVTMSSDEVNSIVAAYNSRLISKAEAIRKFVAGGFTIGDAEQIMDELDTEAGAMPIANQQEQL